MFHRELHFDDARLKIPSGYDSKGEHIVYLDSDTKDEKKGIVVRKVVAKFRSNSEKQSPQSGLDIHIGDLGFARKAGQVFEQQTGSLVGKFVQRFHGNPYYDIKLNVDSLLATGEELVRIDNEIKEIQKKKSNEKKVKENE